MRSPNSEDGEGGELSGEWALNKGTELPDGSLATPAWERRRKNVASTKGQTTTDLRMQMKVNPPLHAFNVQIIITCANTHKQGRPTVTCVMHDTTRHSGSSVP